MAHNFFPMTARMRYIARWGLMRNTQPENIQEQGLADDQGGQRNGRCWPTPWP